MIKYLAKVLSFWEKFKRVMVTQIPRTENQQADTLARLGSAPDEKISSSEQQIFILDRPSIDDLEIVMQVDDAYAIPEWSRSVVDYLKNGELPNDKKEA